MSMDNLKEAYSLLNAEEQGIIQKMHSLFNEVSELGNGLSEEGDMVFDMILSMPFKEGEDALEEIDEESGELKIEKKGEESLDLNSLLGING